MQRQTWNETRGNRPAREWIDLDTPQLLRLVDAQGSAVFVRAGTAWITQEGGDPDILVQAGESFVFDRKGLAIVSPLGHVTLSISAPAGAHVRIGADAPASPQGRFAVAPAAAA
jgi:Protein of unknown function (DUF2917)